MFACYSRFSYWKLGWILLVDTNIGTKEQGESSLRPVIVRKHGRRGIWHKKSWIRTQWSLMGPSEAQYLVENSLICSVLVLTLWPSNKPLSDEAVLNSWTSFFYTIFDFLFLRFRRRCRTFLSFFIKISIAKLVKNSSPKFIWLFISVLLGWLW
jgi:hypothetical protein